MSDFPFSIPRRGDATKIENGTSKMEIETADGDCVFTPNGNALLKTTFDAAGNVGLPTPISGTGYAARLSVRGGLYVEGGEGIRIPREGTNTYADPGLRTWRINQTLDTGVGSALVFRYIEDDVVATAKLRFSPNGQIICSDTVTAAGTVLSSDDRIKENEKLIVNATETLSKLTPQIYDKYQSMDLSGSFTIESGLIAQEVYYNAPELRHLVVVGKDYDASGNEYTQTPEEMDLSGVDIANDPDYGSHGWSKTEQSGLHYQGLIPYLIKSNQELAERLAVLENK